jgi:predicted small lipoprotein YifL
MKSLAAALLLVTLAACRGEKVPRDYQNAPPAMTHPPQSKKETPSANSGLQAAPEPSSGAEGTAAPSQPVNPPVTDSTTTTMKDQAPIRP